MFFFFFLLCVCAVFAFVCMCVCVCVQILCLCVVLIGLNKAYLSDNMTWNEWINPNVIILGILGTETCVFSIQYCYMIVSARKSGYILSLGLQIAFIILACDIGFTFLVLCFQCEQSCLWFFCISQFRNPKKKIKAKSKKQV